MDYQKRVDHFREVMKLQGISAAFVTRRCCMSYFLGVFTPWRSALYIPVEGEIEMITQRYDIGRVKANGWLKNFRGWTSDGDISFTECVIQKIREEKLETASIGFELDTAEQADVLAAKEYIDITAALPNIKIANVIHMVNDDLVMRDSEEIELLRRAAECADVAMEEGFNSLYIGMTETELAGVIEYAGRKAGSMFNWSVTGTEVGSGYRQAYENCYTVIPSHKRIQRGDMITIDLHTMYDLYYADLSLNAVMGEPNEAQKELAFQWKTLVDYLFSLLKPGAHASDIAKAMMEKAKELNVEKFVVPMFGHGLGLEVRIAPTLSPESPHVLKENMAMVAVLQFTNPAVGGMRLEMPCLIKADGAEPLCKTPLDLYVKKL